MTDFKMHTPGLSGRTSLNTTQEKPLTPMTAENPIIHAFKESNDNLREQLLAQKRISMRWEMLARIAVATLRDPDKNNYTQWCEEEIKNIQNK